MGCFKFVCKCIRVETADIEDQAKNANFYF